jgi:hypothetical protein
VWKEIRRGKKERREKTEKRTEKGAMSRKEERRKRK